MKRARPAFSRVGFLRFGVAWVLFPGLQAAASQPENSVAVLTVAQVVVEHLEPATVCWRTIVSDRERARTQYESQPWVVRHWQPILGAVLGGAVAYQFTGNYGANSQKWVYPTLLGGMAVGAAVGPGMVAGAYAGGMLAQHFWPTKLPVTIALSMLGGVLGDGLMKFLFPEDPLLADTQPGQYLPDQQFYVETRCVASTRVSYTETPYRATYRYKGEARSALFRYYPGDRIELDTAGRPLKEIQGEQPENRIRVSSR